MPFGDEECLVCLVWSAMLLPGPGGIDAESRVAFSGGEGVLIDGAGVGESAG